MNEEEIRQRIKLLEERKEGYLEVGKPVSRIENEIYKWEDLLNKLDKSRYEEYKEERDYYKRKAEKQQIVIGKAIDYIEKSYYKKYGYRNIPIEKLNLENCTYEPSLVVLGILEGE